MSFVDFYASIIEAYYDCRKGKRNTYNCIEFETDAMKNCFDLASEIYYGTYEISWSICFIVDYPVTREIFAACFRDRIVHHWIGLRLSPLFEELFYDSMNSNRVGKGTKAAIELAAKYMKECSENYTKDCYVYRGDLQGFFMSIDKRILNRKIQSFVDEHYFEDDKYLLKILLELVIMHCPQHKCIKKCPDYKWDKLPKRKSLFYQDQYHGLAIGNLTSQMLANFLLHFVLEFIYDSGFKYLVEYVDDFLIFSTDKKLILAFIPKLRKFLKRMGITLHPNKFYFQHYTKGVLFLGTYIKPYIKLIGHRIKTQVKRKYLNSEEQINSYLGLTRHCCNSNFQYSVILSCKNNLIQIKSKSIRKY